MEQVIDKLRAEMDALVQTSDFFDIMNVTTETKFDDPGLVMVDEYPYIYVSPINETPRSETTTYDVIDLTIQIGVVVNAGDYFDPSVNELPASRELTAASKLIRKYLRRDSKRNLDGMSGVRDLRVQQIDYVPDLREDVFVRIAVLTIAVERQYQHED